MREDKKKGTKTILFYAKVKGGDDTLLRKITVNSPFSPDKDWMNTIEPDASYYI